MKLPEGRCESIPRPISPSLTQLQIGLGLQGLYSATNCTDNILYDDSSNQIASQSRLICKFNEKISV